MTRNTDSKKTVAFAGMSDKQKRVTIAQDVLAQLRAKTFVPSHGYVDAVFSSDDVCKNMDLRDALPKAEKCEACAIGGMFLAVARLRDEMPMHKVALFPGERLDSWPSVEIDLDLSDVLAVLTENGFEEDEALRIEDAYECANRDDIDLDEADDGDARRAAVKFGRRFKNDKNRMIAIMENIAAHGNFKPEELK